MKKITSTEKGNKNVAKKSTIKDNIVLKRKKVPKKEVVEEDVVDNYEEMLVPIAEKRKKVVGGKKLLVNVLVVPLDNNSFQSGESVLKWKYVFHRRTTP